jgi:hypothetical protein
VVVAMGLLRLGEPNEDESVRLETAPRDPVVRPNMSSIPIGARSWNEAIADYCTRQATEQPRMAV